MVTQKFKPFDYQSVEKKGVITAATARLQFKCCSIIPSLLSILCNIYHQVSADMSTRFLVTFVYYVTGVNANFD